MIQPRGGAGFSAGVSDRCETADVVATLLLFKWAQFQSNPESVFGYNVTTQSNALDGWAQAPCPHVGPANLVLSGQTCNAPQQ